MENSEFDKYIKSYTQKDLDVPEGLSWEEMNISLPEQKKKRRGFIWILLVLLGVVLGGSIVTLLQLKKETSKSIVKENVVFQKTPIESNTIAKKIPSETKLSNTQILDNNTSASNTNSKSSKKRNQINRIRINENKKTNQNLFASETTSTVETIGKLIQINKPISILNETSQKNKTEVSNSIFRVQNIDGIKILLLAKDNDLPQLDWIDFSKDNDETKLSLFFKIGINQSQSNYTQGNQLAALTAAEGLAFGNSVQLGVKFPLKKKFFVTTGFTYQQLHTTFTHSEDLGTEVNFALEQRISRVRNIYHNNYFEFVELNIGVGREFLLGENWGSQLTLSLNPSYQLKATGRTLNEDLSVYEMENHKTVDRLLWTAGGGLDLFFNVKNNRFLAGVDLKQSLSTIQLLENSDLQFQPKIFNFKLGLERIF